MEEDEEGGGQLTLKAPEGIPDGRTQRLETPSPASAAAAAAAAASPQRQQLQVIKGSADVLMHFVLIGWIPRVLSREGWSKGISFLETLSIAQHISLGRKGTKKRKGGNYVGHPYLDDLWTKKPAFVHRCEAGVEIIKYYCARGSDGAL